MTENHEQQPGGDVRDNEDRDPKGPRRSRRIKYIVGALAIAVIGVVGVGATAKYWFHARWHDGGYERFVDHRIDTLLDRIEASDEQRATVKPVLMGASDELRGLYVEMREDRRTLAAALTGEAIDREAIEALRAARVASMDRASRRTLQALADAAEALTPEQRALIAEKLARHGHRRD